MTPPPVVRSAVEPGKPSADYREVLRGDFVFTCASCFRAETEAQVSFEIEHWQPQKHGGSDAYSNLYWSCDKCNLRKGTHYYSASRVFIRVDIECPSTHLQLAPDYRVEEKTKTGEFNKELLNLNSKAHVRVRKIRANAYKCEQVTLQGFRALRKLRIDRIPRTLRFNLERVVRQLEEQQGQLEAEINDLLDAKCRVIGGDPLSLKEKNERRRYLYKMKKELVASG